MLRIIRPVIGMILSKKTKNVSLEQVYGVHVDGEVEGELEEVAAGLGKDSVEGSGGGGAKDEVEAVMA